MSSVPSSFNVSATSGILGSYLSSSNSTGLFSAFSANNANPTTAALQSGKLTQTQYKIIQSIAAAGTAGYAIPFNANGTEPSTIANLRSYGWLKLTGKSVNSDTKTNQGTYVLTKVGQAIYDRTSGGALGSSGASSAAASATATLSSQVSALAGVLSSFGVDVSA